MSKQVVFGGATLTRAGGASTVDASAYQNLGPSGLGTVALVGEANGGAPNTVLSFSNPAAMVAYFRSGPLADAADLAFRPMTDPRVPGGASQVICVKTNQATQATATLNKGGSSSIVITSRDFGDHTNRITVQTYTVSGGKVVNIVFNDSPTQKVETSPPLAATPEITIQYVGTGTTATAAITSTTFTTTVTGVTGDSLSLPLRTYSKLSDLIAAINTNPAYVATATGSNPFAFATANLDTGTLADIKTAPVGFKASQFRVLNWINTYSQLVTATMGTVTTGAPDDQLSPMALTGGTRGTSSNSNFQTAFNLLGGARINQIVPLVSQDLTALGDGGTATFASVAAIADAHAATYSSTTGKSERQCYLGMKGSKTQLLVQASGLQSIHSVLTGQAITRLDRNGNLYAFPEWALAVIMAGARAGSLPGEPLVYKVIQGTALTQDASWNPVNDGADLVLGGVSLAFAAPGGGFKFDRVVSTYTKADNDAYCEESVITTWKAISYDIRSQLENIFTGVRGLPSAVQGVKDAIARICEAYRVSGQIVDGTDPTGATVKAYRNISATLNNGVLNVSVTLSIVSGITFQLNTILLVPAAVSAQ